MKKILIFILGILVGVVASYFVIVNNIEIDNVTETENGLVTIKVFNQYIDYAFERGV